MALQRSAGNGAVAALMAGKAKAAGDAVAEIDRALTEVRGGDPDIEAVERGLKATKAAGVPVDIDGEAQKPGPNALVVTKTGFGPGSVTPKKPVPPTRPVKPVSPLGKAAAKAPRPTTPAKAPAPKSPTTRAGGGAGGGAGPTGPVPLAPGAELAPPVAPTGTRPADDPAFQQVKGGVAGVAGATKAHPTAASKAREAQGAAQAPAEDLAGQAQAAKADSMDAQQAGSFDKVAFIAAVKTAIEAKAPKTLEEAESARGKAGEVKGAVKGMVGANKDGAAKDIEAATDAPPDQSKAVAKDVTPMATETPGPPGVVPAAGAAPKPAPAEQTNLAAGKHQADQEMTDAGVTEQQLAKSNEPEFEGALKEKKKAAEHADTAPAQYREQEKAQIETSKAEAGAETQAGMAGMHGAKGAAIAQLVAEKGQAKSKDETKRAEVTARIQAIFTATETDVKKILDGIDAKVDAEFEAGEASAKAAFEAFVEAKMSAYKRERYGGWLGGLKWAKDKLLGMPSAVDAFYEAGRELYLQRMDGVISRVADIVGGDLGAAKQRIARGKGEISAYVKSLPQDLQKVGNEAATEMGERFEQLESDVDAKQNELVESLATKYVEARKGLDERIEAMQAENKGFVDAAIGAIKGVIDTIKGLVDMLKNVLARAASAIEDIIKDPVGFLGNLVAGIKGGIMRFFANIGTHLKKGLMGWLFGQLADAGIEMPETFDLKGIIKLVASIFGLSWANIRTRIVKQIGEKAMGAIEKGVDIFQKIASGGIGAVWELLLEKLGDIKAMIMEQIEDFVLTKVITAGITWLIGLLNPAAAFIKACKLIYDVIMFFVTNGSRIMKLVTTIIDGIVDIAKGNVSSVMAKIEDVLGQMVPILIGFLASVLGVGGIGEKIKSIIQTLQKPFNKAIDFVVKAGLKLAGPVIRGMQGLGRKAKAKAGRLKDKALAKLRGGDDTPAGKQKRLDQGMAAATSAVDRLSGSKIGLGAIKPVLGAVKVRFGMTSLEAFAQQGVWHVRGAVNPTAQKPTTKVVMADEKDVAEASKYLGKSFVVRATHRIATVSAVLKEGMVLLRYDLRRSIGGTSKTKEGSVSLKLATFLKNMPGGGAELVPDGGGAGATKYTLNGKDLKPAYHKVRAIFYGFGYQALKPAKVAEVAKPDGTFTCPGWKRAPHVASVVGAQLDHKRSVASHWTSDGGNATSQSARQQFDRRLGNLQLLCQPCNGAKGSEDDDGSRPAYVKTVSIPSFTGPDGDP